VESPAPSSDESSSPISNSGLDPYFSLMSRLFYGLALRETAVKGHMLYISISSSLLPNTFQRREVNNTIGTIILIYVSVAIGMYNLLGSAYCSSYG